ncbi:hypothetical protein [Stigmatella erecta]|uniref:Uncharacterized protein n=1 Tax=Stigmatella erecta TaxID=83460 RepID=A0A1I0JK69_9BACT|nr:hypothetical protein [Stigmatella erecta]SEU10016.1 hypothetical protein SAMN05443639_107310 [Stigmatella erecta]
MSSNRTDIVPAASTQLATPSYRQDLQIFERSLLAFIEQHGLPTQNVLVPVSERVKVFGNIEGVLDQLGLQHKQQSVYISKFIAATASGLFDAALNYLWDETVAELRKRVAQYDLDYFFDLAVKNPDKRKKLSTSDDLAHIDDCDLIRGASELGLVSELGYRHLDYIRYMRNWASAAHPNQNQLTGLQLVGWFETCVREVITLPETNVAAQIGKLLRNVRANPLDAAGANQVAAFFIELTSDQSNNLAAGFFGIYTNDQSLPQARVNVTLLAPFLWPFVSEATRKELGIKYAQFVSNNDADRAKWAREFLDAVGAASYIPDNIRAAEIETALQELLSAHRGWNNFHVEPAFSRRLATLVDEKGHVPQAVSIRYVETLTEVFLTNGNGVAWSADPIYQMLLSRLDSTQALLAVLSFRNKHLASKLQFDLCGQKYNELLTLAKTKVSSPQGLEIISLIENYRGPREAMAKETRLMEKVSAITRSLGV